MELTDSLSDGTNDPLPYALKFFGYPLLSQERETGIATDFQLGWYIYRVHLNKSPLKILAKRERGRICRDCPNFLGTPIISGPGKATNFKSCMHIHGIDRNKSPLKISRKVAVGVVRDSRKFSGHPYTGRISRSSLRYISFLVWYKLAMVSCPTTIQ